MASKLHPFKPLHFLRACALGMLVAGLLAHASAALAEDWSVFGDDYPSISAPEAMVVDGDGNMLYSRDGDVRMPMASTTKVMTAVVALESGLPLDTVYTVSDSVLALDPASSIVGYAPGQQVTLEELLRALLVHSGNDAALVIAECVAGSEDAFVAMMNTKAMELGLVNTHYANPHGLDQENHYSTAADLITLGRYAMQFPLFASIVGSPVTVIDVGGQPTSFASTDELLNVYPGMRGIKTGYTYGAGRAFLGVASRGGQTIYLCVLGTDSNETRWTDTRALLDWAFAHYPEKSLASSDDPVFGYVELEDRFGWVMPTTVGTDVSIRTSPFEMETEPLVDATVDTTPSSPGDAAGQITWSEEGVIVESRTVTTTDQLIEKSSFGPVGSSAIYELDRM